MIESLPKAEKQHMKIMVEARMKKMYQDAPREAQQSIDMSEKLRSLFVDKKEQDQLGEFLQERESILMSEDNLIEILFNKVNELEKQFVLLESKLLLGKTVN